MVRPSAVLVAAAIPASAWSAFFPQTEVWTAEE
jgi:hypothetical protein